MESFTIFGDLLRHLRRRAHLTQRELGISLRYSESQIARLEANQRLPNVAAVKATFITALQLQHEPELAARLIELAEAAHEVTDEALQRAQSSSSVRMTRFVGRDRDMAEVRNLLSNNRLVTLTGTGGVGKTRLAIEIAASVAVKRNRNAIAFRDGVKLAELASITDPLTVVRAVASVFGLAGRPGRTGIQTLQSHLADKRLLLIIDNCEHLITSTAMLVETLLSACPGVTILATSREPLRVAGERVWRLAPLQTPNPNMLEAPEKILNNEAVQLFIENAAAAQPGFMPQTEDVAVIARICRMLDGIPLAIEMAAAQTPALSVREIAASLDNNFALLSSGRRTALPRQQTLRATLDWSYALLTPPEQSLLAGLSVFSGSWGASAARSVCGNAPDQPAIGRRARRATDVAAHLIPQAEVIPLIAQLVHKSVVVAEERDGKKRYRLLHTIRQYAMEKLEASGAANEYRRRHASFYLGMIEKPDEQWPRLEDMRWYRTLESEYSDLRSALGWCLSPAGDAVLGLRLAVTLAGLWQYRGWFWRAPSWLSEGRELLDAALSNALDAPLTLKAAALYWLALMQDGYDSVIALAEECLALCRESGDNTYIAAALSHLGHLVMWEQDHIRSETLSLEAVELYRRLEAEEHLAGALSLLGHAYLEHAKYSQAASVLEESLAIWREKDVAWSSLGGIARALLWLGRTVQLQGDLPRAERLLAESVELYREVGDRNGAGWAQLYLGETALSRHDLPTAVSRFGDAVPLFSEGDDAAGIAVALAGMAAVCDARHEQTAAARFAGAAAAIGAPQTTTWQLGHSEKVNFDRAIKAAQAHLSDARIAAAWVEGQGMSLSQAVAMALNAPVQSIL